jgi:hypothetical protein
LFEGEPVGRLLIQRWPSETAFREWQASEEYRPLRERRMRAADLRIAIVAATWRSKSSAGRGRGGKAADGGRPERGYWRGASPDSIWEC